MVGKCAFDEIRVAVRDVEMDVIEPEPLDLMVDRARDDIARRQLGALVKSRHEALAAALPPGGSFSCPPSPRTASVIRKFLTSRL